MIPVTPVLTNGGSDLMILADLNTRADTYVIADINPTTVHVPPGELLEIGDRATISAGSGGCSVQQLLGNSAPTFQLPVPFTAVVDRTSAQWNADQTVDWEFANLFVTQDDVRMSMFAQMTWLEAHGDTTNTPRAKEVRPNPEAP
mgnify:CR=1 FL=1